MKPRTRFKVYVALFVFGLVIGVLITPLTPSRTETLISLSFPILLPLIAVTIFESRARVKRRAGPRRCVQCGYDLSGLDAGRPCPECSGRPR